MLVKSCGQCCIFFLNENPLFSFLWEGYSSTAYEECEPFLAILGPDVIKALLKFLGPGMWICLDLAGATKAPYGAQELSEPNSVFHVILEIKFGS